MFNVICIQEPNNYTPCGAEPIVKCGETYLVTNLGKGYVMGQAFDWYEISIHKGYCYAQHLFASLSSIDETEMIREYNTEKV